MVRIVENVLLISFAVSFLVVKSLANDVPIHNDILVFTFVIIVIRLIFINV